MPQNIHLVDRIIRYAFGIILLTWAMAGGPAWSYIGVYFLFTASFGSCLLYWFLRINSTQ